MENQIKYRFRRMELEQLAMFEENYDKDVKEVQFQTTSPRRPVHPLQNDKWDSVLQVIYLQRESHIS